MSAEAQWDNNTKTTIVVTLADALEWWEIHQTLTYVLTLLDSVDHYVDAIINLKRDVILPPKGFVENVKRIALTLLQHPHFHIMVFVLGKSPFRDLISTAAASYGAPECGRLFATDIDEARSLLSLM